MPKALTRDQKSEVVNYIVEFSKGVIEDDMECPRVCGGFDRQEITRDDIEAFVGKCKVELLALVQAGKL